MTGRSPKARLASGDGCFADQSFAFVKVSFLLAYVHDDPRLSGSAVVIPPACGSGARIKPRLIRRWVLFATANNQRCEQRACNSQYSAIIHKAADTIQRKVTHSTLKSVLIGQVVASKKRRVSAGGVEPLGFNQDRKIRGRSKSRCGSGENPDMQNDYARFYSAGDDAV
jgi:hypothetical protein